MKILSAFFSIVFLILGLTEFLVVIITLIWGTGELRIDYLILGAVTLWLSWILQQDSKKTGQ